MVDPLDSPPRDHGSDRYGYVELIGAPAGVNPAAALIDAVRCPDCLSNIFLTYVGPLDVVPVHAGSRVRFWQPEIAHDDGCPTFARIEREGP